MSFKLLADNASMDGAADKIPSVNDPKLGADFCKGFPDPIVVDSAVGNSKYQGSKLMLLIQKNGMLCGISNIRILESSSTSP